MCFIKAIVQRLRIQTFVVSGGASGSIFRSRSSPRDLPSSFVAPHVGGGVRIFVREKTGVSGFSVDGYYVSNGYRAAGSRSQPGRFFR